MDVLRCCTGAIAFFRKFTLSCHFRLKAKRNLAFFDFGSGCAALSQPVETAGGMSVSVHVLAQRHVGRLTADMPSGAGVCVFSLNGDLPLGFGTSAKATAEIHAAHTEAVSFYHHADVGEYLREEADLV